MTSSGCSSRSRSRLPPRRLHGRPRMRRESRRMLLCVALAAMASLSGARAQTILHTEKSLYRNVTVVEEDGLRCMKFSRYYEGSRQSCMSLKDPDRLVFDYTRMMLGSLYLCTEPKRILIV